jgi:glycine dehydrogenase
MAHAPYFNAPLAELQNNDEFVGRHIGPNANEVARMLETIGAPSIQALIEQTVPASILRTEALDLPAAASEQQALREIASFAKRNKVFKTYIGMGYHDTYTPNVILRNVLENPGWYTAYTPYQPEIAQGRLEGLINFQQMITDLTGMDLANASMLDESTAAAEAMAMCKRQVRKNKSERFFVDAATHPQTIAVIQTRAEHFGFDVIIGDHSALNDGDYFGALLQNPGTSGEVRDLTEVITTIHSHDALAVVATDLMSLVITKSPGSMGADVVIGTNQRFGIPMGFGGPHAAFFAFRDDYKRSAPGRIIGVSRDSRGKTALRMAMQTREQHIRREKANSNICTSQVLLAVMSAFYAVYHGPDGLKRIAHRIHRLTRLLADGLQNGGRRLRYHNVFDTLCVEVGNEQASIMQAALDAQINLRALGDDAITLSLNETTEYSDVVVLLALFGCEAPAADAVDAPTKSHLDESLLREDAFLTHPVFNSYHSETEMLRYLKRLESKDIALNHSMIPLGSCTMKLNATAEMIPVTWPEFGKIHPFAPMDQAEGYRQLFEQLQVWLAECTGYDFVSLQPNAGSQGEYAGLVVIKKYHQSRGEGHRNICLIPSSAHGTNPASANMVSMKVVVVGCDKHGNVDIDDLRAKAEMYSDNLAALMVTYPSTHGVFESRITEICDIIHEHGGQVYIDGANMNALVGIAGPGKFGGDVSHLNLHKTFCIPHGGGGPGMGPIGVREHLAPFLASHPLQEIPNTQPSNGTISAAPWGSASILPISWMYIRMMGSVGMRQASEYAILNANYIATRLEPHYPILYKGISGTVAHECLLDLRPIKEASGVSEEDIAKRLNDFGYHAPTMSFPVAGTLMIEPTESESLAELDRFCDAMIQIRKEIAMVENGQLPADNNPLCNAPHTSDDIIGEWDRPYSRELAAFPAPWVRQGKVWPSVNRIDNVFGDRNLICSCPSMDEYM